MVDNSIPAAPAYIPDGSVLFDDRRAELTKREADAADRLRVASTVLEEIVKLSGEESGKSTGISNQQRIVDEFTEQHDRAKELLDALPQEVTGEWAVVRRSIARGKAQELRDALWAAGIFPSTTTDQFTGDQWRTWEEDWAQRIPLYVRSWSLRDENGEPLPVSRESVELMDDRVYQRLCMFINRLMQGLAPEDAKSERPHSVGLGEGNARRNGHATADAGRLPAEAHVGTVSPPSLS